MYSEEQLKSAIKKAWNEGREWGVAYSGWFSPNDNDHENHYREAELKAIEAAQQSAQADEGDTLAETELSNDEMDPFFDII